MVQEFYVLKCFSCETFQSHIVKKTNKWECKVCGNKQSLKKVYGRGSGKDCRLHTQKLNALRGEKEYNQRYGGSDNEDNKARPEQLLNNQQPSCIEPSLTLVKTSKWRKYVKEDQIDTAKSCIQQEKNRAVNDVSCSKMKRKNEKDVLHSKDRHSINTEPHGSLDDDYISFGYSVSTRNTKKPKYQQSSDCKISGCDIFETADEDNGKVKSPNINVNKQSKTNVQAQNSLKWRKYLYEDQLIEKDMTNDSALSASFSDSASLEEKESEPAITECNGLHLGTPGKYKNLFGSNNKHISFKPCATIINQQQCNIISEGLREEYGNGFIEESNKNNENIWLDKEQTIRQSLVSMPIFEQDCNLSDTDFQLDF